MEIKLTRRQTLICTLLYISEISGCWPIRRPMRPDCPKSSDMSYLHGALTIDAHCHVFNGTDLQIADFLSKIATHQQGPLKLVVESLGEILNGLAWALAPNGGSELKALEGVDQALRTCASGNAALRTSNMRQEAYSKGRQELKNKLNTSRRFTELREKFKGPVSMIGLDAITQTQVAAINLIDWLPEDVDLYTAQRAPMKLTAMSVGEKTAIGAIAFVLQNFQYRYVSVHDYLRTYNQPNQRVVDLMLPSMVDYDWWLAEGHRTTTHLDVQIQVMKQISILIGGRVHGFVPFDPLKQAAFKQGLTTENPMALVIDAIEKYGCVGVKLYPPMGFAALGNVDLKGKGGASFWARKGLPPIAWQSDTGKHLDTAMRELFKWCVENQVPVMAHTNQSNGPSEDFEVLAGFKYWKKALTDFPGLRVSFGHFGDVANKSGHSESAAFTTLMNEASGSVGEHAYADAGYYVEVLSNMPELRDDLRQLYKSTSNKSGAALASRFMYGTDWEMTLVEGDINAYLSDFIELFNELEGTSEKQKPRGVTLADRFFGLNAVDWIGLKSGDRARDRLETFYREYGVPKPDWAKKVDNDPSGI